MIFLFLNQGDNLAEHTILKLFHFMHGPMRPGPPYNLSIEEGGKRNVLESENIPLVIWLLEIKDTKKVLGPRRYVPIVELEKKK